MEEDRTVFQRSAARSIRPGARLNNVYEIERLVAQGGMGEVYRGFNIQTGDPVAIKMIRPEFSNDPEILELFRREASILHSFTHDAIVRYFVFSVDPQLQRAYLAMEFVEGPSLKKRLSSGPLPLAEVRILQKRVASALEAAHQHGVVHRDISPDNVIMPDGDVRSAKVIDFGIARARRAGETTIIGGALRRQVELRVAGTTGPRRRRRHRQIGHLQFRPCPGGGAARPADRHGGVAGGDDRQAARRSPNFPGSSRPCGRCCRRCCNPCPRTARRAWPRSRPGSQRRRKRRGRSKPLPSQTSAAAGLRL